MADVPIPIVNTVMIDCLDIDAMASFWSQLLGVEERFRVEGQYIWLTPQRKGGWSVAFQQVTDPTPGKNKLHLDGEFDDLDALTARIESLGGRVVETHEMDGFVWNVYADVEGNVFCLGHPLA